MLIKMTLWMHGKKSQKVALAAVFLCCIAKLKCSFLERTEEIMEKYALNAEGVESLKVFTIVIERNSSITKSVFST